MPNPNPENLINKLAKPDPKLAAANKQPTAELRIPKDSNLGKSLSSWFHVAGESVHNHQAVPNPTSRRGKAKQPGK